jgi:ABC-type transport system involved in multi-copper enzyme maturation permease subunit
LGVVLGPDTGLGLGVVASTFGIHLGQLAVATLGVLIVSGEYSTGMIRSTLVAVPKRLPVLWAKAIVFAVVAFVVGVLATLATFLATGPILAAGEMGSSLGNHEVQRILVGAGLYLAAVGVLSMGLGAIVRNAAGGIGAAVALLVVLPGLITLIPGEWVQQVTPFLPSNAGQRIIEEVSATATLGPWQGYGVLLLWVAATLAAAAVTLRRRDA